MLLVFLGYWLDAIDHDDLEIALATLEFEAQLLLHCNEDIGRTELLNLIAGGWGDWCVG
jgi:hypothetical protein